MRKRILLSLISIGVTAISAQIILIRELFSIFYGNELSIGFILAIWLLGGSIGSGFFGKFFADRIQSKIILFSLILVVLSALIPGGIICARILRPAFGISVGEIVSLPAFIITSSIILLPIATALGFLFVLGCKIVPREVGPVTIGRVYTLEAIGATVGGILTGLILIRVTGALHIAFILSFFNLLVAILLLQKNCFSASGRVLKLFSIVMVILLAGFASFRGIGLLDRGTTDIKWKPFRVLKVEDSIYGRTAVTARGDQLNFYNNGLFLFSTHDPLTAEESVHFPMIFSSNPGRVLLIGGGASEAMSEILKHPVRSVDYIELDPMVVSFSKEFLQGNLFKLNDPRVNVIITDGRYFIKNTKNKYDVVIMHLPNPYTAQINRFYTVEFFREIKRAMGDDSILGFSVSSSENYLSKEQSLFLRTLYETAKSEFKDVRVIPGDTAYFLCAKKDGLIELSPGVMSRILDRRQIKTVYVRDYYLSSKISRERLDSFDRAIINVKHARKNFDFYPISYFYDMVLWSTYFNFSFAKFILFFTKKRLLIMVGAFFVTLFIIYFAKRRHENFKKQATLLALCTTGLSEISFQILIVLGFQIIYGYLYYKIGIIMTFFMVGLGLGSTFMTRLLPGIREAYKKYILIQLLVLAYPIILLLSFKAFSLISSYPAGQSMGSALFAALPFMAGFVGGLQYPLANKICLEDKSEVGKTAGSSYAADLFGSFLGALLISAFFVPIVGIPMTCILVTTLNAVTLAILLLAKRSVLT